jgi:two-component system sensor histidine kinase MprB
LLARSLESVDDALGTLRAFLFLVVVGGAGLAALGARVIAGRLLVPVGRLTDAAEHVSETEDLSRRIKVEGDDELAQLGDRFNAMLERLEDSRHELDEAHDDQRRLIADASHELRTPVTALRTNIEVMAKGGLSADDERRALDAASAQAEELGVLIGDLMDLSRGEPEELEFEEVRLDQVVGESVERARRNSPGVRFDLEVEPTVVNGAPDRIARAVNNLLANAAQHGLGEAVEVGVKNGVVSVRDHGPGIDATEADRLFDRFYRGSDARRRPGSGLGLAIVRQVADAHGASVSVAPAEGGGAVFELRFDA